MVGASRLVQRDKAICMIPGMVLGRDGIWLSYMGDMGACELKSTDADFSRFFGGSVGFWRRSSDGGSIG